MQGCLGGGCCSRVFCGVVFCWRFCEWALHSACGGKSWIMGRRYFISRGVSHAAQTHLLHRVIRAKGASVVPMKSLDWEQMANRLGWRHSGARHPEALFMLLRHCSASWSAPLFWLSAHLLHTQNSPRAFSEHAGLSSPCKGVGTRADCAHLDRYCMPSTRDEICLMSNQPCTLATQVHSRPCFWGRLSHVRTAASALLR